jgi:hypothetical protein
MNDHLGIPGIIPGKDRSKAAIDANPPVSTIAFNSMSSPQKRH